MKVYCAAGFIDDRASVVEEATRDANPALARQLDELRKKAQGIRSDVEHAISNLSSADAMERALVTSSVGMSVMRSAVARVNLALMTSSDAAAKQAGRELSRKLDALQSEVPPEEPTRGCR